MNKNKQSGFTLVEIMIVVAIIGLLAAIAIPSFMRARTTSQANACINNLRQIDSGKEQLGMEQGLINGAFVLMADLVGPNNFIKQWPVCPNLGDTDADGNDWATVQAQAEASYGGDAAPAGYDAADNTTWNGMCLGVNAECLIGAAFDVAHALPAQN